MARVGAWSRVVCKTGLATEEKAPNGAVLWGVKYSVLPAGLMKTELERSIVEMRVLLPIAPEPGIFMAAATCGRLGCRVELMALRVVALTVVRTEDVGGVVTSGVTVESVEVVVGTVVVDGMVVVCVVVVEGAVVVDSVDVVGSVEVSTMGVVSFWVEMVVDSTLMALVVALRTLHMLENRVMLFALHGSFGGGFVQCPLPMSRYRVSQ